MKGNFFNSLHFRMCATAILGGTLLSGCSSPSPTHRPVVVTPTGEIFVRESPPPPRAEGIEVVSDSGTPWVPGYWTYSNSHWVWMPGRFDLPPQHGETWVEGHWDHTARGWVFTPGHWE